MKNAYSISYNVDKEKGIVVCLLHCRIYNAINYVNSHFMQNNLAVYLDFGKDERFYMPCKFTGIAKCSVDDEFDEEVGKRIARQRATELYQRSLWKHIRNIYDSLTVAMIEMEGKLFF